MNSGPDLTAVDSPFIDQFTGMDWKPVINSLGQPSVPVRETFREVLIKSDFRKAMARIYLREGKPCLDDAHAEQKRIVAVVRGLQGRLDWRSQKLRVMKHGLMEELLTGRVRVTSLLTEGAV